jgi:apolipoprotein D and lipocalin family protein
MKRRTMQLVLSASLLFVTLSNGGTPMFTPVDGFELSKYLGTWYEIARMPASFEKDLVGVTATYSVRSDGKVDVLNKGCKKTIDGEKSVARGKAKFAGDPTKGHLKVAFFWIFYADYVVVALDKEHYDYALVISSKSYMWILSRKPTLEASILARLIDQAKGLGIDTSKLIMAPQS